MYKYCSDKSDADRSWEFIRQKRIYLYGKKLQETYLTKTWKMLESLRSNVLNEVRAIPGSRDMHNQRPKQITNCL